MPALLRSDPSLVSLIDLHGLERIRVFGLVGCPAGCEQGWQWVAVLDEGDVQQERCPTCQGAGVVPGDQRDA